MNRVELMNKRERVAYHESSHAVATVAVRAECLGAEIKMDGTGIAWSNQSDDGSLRERTLRRLIVTVAGPLGENRFCGHRPGNGTFSGDISNIKTALADGGVADPDIGHPLVREAMAAALKILTENADAVALVARYLNRHSEIDGYRARLMVAEASLGNDYLGS